MKKSEKRTTEESMLRRKFGFKREAVTGEWRKFLYEELKKYYSSPYITRAIK
jgi:hypothetical protein